MIICPSCQHNNPDGALNCEACFTILPIVQMIECPNCRGSVLSNAKFCGHCGYNLTSGSNFVGNSNDVNSSSSDVIEPHPPLNHIASNIPIPMSNLSSQNFPPSPDADTHGDISGADIALEINAEIPTAPTFTQAEPVGIFSNEGANSYAKTQLQQVTASLLHVQTNLELEIPANLPVIHIGKPNNVIPPDIDVSGFPDSDIVSRIHADIRIEGGYFYFEDTGSSNGTYINNLPLAAGNRHKLRAGDRISLGKGDKVSFIFQMKG
jgi:hypothetical protein